MRPQATPETLDRSKQIRKFLKYHIKLGQTRDDKLFKARGRAPPAEVSQRLGALTCAPAEVSQRLRALTKPPAEVSQRLSVWVNAPPEI